MKDVAFYEALGQAIRMKREQKRMTQGELSDLVEMSRPSVVNIELGRQSVLVHGLCRFAHALGVQPADLLQCALPVPTMERPMPESPEGCAEILSLGWEEHESGDLVFVAKLYFPYGPPDLPLSAVYDSVPIKLTLARANFKESK
jgi:transcriptional regulator with XRE-family HTH domain